MGMKPLENGMEGESKENFIDFWDLFIQAVG